jgi:diphthamide synthase subunit DPH2
MISDFLLKGIDNFWNDKVDIKNSKKPVFSRDTLKRELSTIIKAKRDISQSRYGERQQEGTASKSRLLLHQ